MMGLAAGCGTNASETPEQEPVFRGIADSCAEIAAPAMDVIRAYTGELFSDTTQFEETGAPSTAVDLTTRECRATYAASAAPAVPATGFPPSRRVFHLRIALRGGDDALEAAERDFDSACASVDCRATTGIGDESFEGSVEGSSNTAITMFRSRNAIVSVTVDGSDFSSRPGENGRSAEISELVPGSRTVAQAIAANLNAVLT
ncbi:hypothetical protein [Nocardia testacea]|uniref:DUF5642 domain-containing protein n=1 Tax=Nocardia testacea TaxID=248551 RepID=A0ABW7W804_9NOCA